MSARHRPIMAALGHISVPQTHSRSIIESTLAEAILNGTIRPGTPLRQEELAEVFGVSRMPVREALIQLEGKGLVRLQAGKGAVAMHIDPADLMETYDVRLIIEPAALRLSIPHLTETDITEIRSHVRDMESETDAPTVGRLNTEFHMALCRRATNYRLLKLVRAALEEEEQIIRLHLTALGADALGQPDHRALADAAAARDAVAATDILHRHITAAAATLRDYLSVRESAVPVALSNK
ncbi:GntR family transcriptional regulator [Nocardia sp. NPDC051756]|uniref:GntR family transcriptional regulator n=1 Tax=Nocardia sp. NPDC051756 TaxID=3154751 RepID=UPI0034259589